MREGGTLGYFGFCCPFPRKYVRGPLSPFARWVLVWELKRGKKIV